MPSLNFTQCVALGLLLSPVGLVACSDTATSTVGSAGASGAGFAGALASAGAGAGGLSNDAQGLAGAAGVGGSAGASANTAGAGAAGEFGAGGASAGSGGASGGASGSAGEGGNAGATMDGCGAADVCDDFEAYEPGMGYGPWEQNGEDGVLEVDETHAFSGKQSVHFKIDAGSSTLQLKRTDAPIFPATNNTFWGSMMVWATDIPQNRVHFDIVQASGDNYKEGYFLSGMPGARLIYQPFDCYVETQNVIPEGEWACWEWLFDGTNNILEFYINGVLNVRVENSVGKNPDEGCVHGPADTVWEAPEFRQLGIGWINYQGKDAVNDLWLDDFAVGPERIGCPVAGEGTH